MIMTYEQQVAEWRKAMKKGMKKVLSSKTETRKFLIRAGILDKSGKLAKRYRG